jgi:hydroxymethylpyrimidine/phosphomethylpyrimidine kinase
VTPNLAEARVLADDPSLDARDAAVEVHALGEAAVVVTGGDEDGVDWFCDRDGTIPIDGPFHASRASHGSGCTHAAALAVYLARGSTPLEAAIAARELAAGAVAHGLEELGGGAGPVNVAAAVLAR